MDPYDYDDVEEDYEGDNNRLQYDNMMRIVIQDDEVDQPVRRDSDKELTIDGDDLLNFTDEDLESMFEAYENKVVELLLVNINDESIIPLKDALMKYKIKVQKLEILHSELESLQIDELPDCEEFLGEKCGLEELPKLPKCKKLVCNDNELNKLPKLPNVVGLNCNYNKIKKLPEMPKLAILHCTDNEIEELPSLPNCKEIICFRNEFEKMAKVYPSLEVFDCSDTNINSLPMLPKVQRLDCYGNKLTTLPDMPKLEELECYENELTSLPNMPNAKHINCNFNQITKIENYPELTFLDCSNNKLTIISNIPSIMSLNCNNNPQLRTISGPTRNLEKISFINTGLDQREIYMKSDNIQDITINERFYQFPPAVELIEKGITGDQLFDIINTKIDTTDMMKIKVLEDKYQNLPQSITLQIAKKVEAMYKSVIFMTAQVLEDMYLKTVINNSLLDRLYEDYESQINPDWSNQTIVDFLASKYFENELRPEFNQKLTQVYQTTYNELKKMIKKLFKKSKKFFKENYSHHVYLGFKSLLESMQKVTFERYRNVLEKLFAKLNKQAVEQFHKNFFTEIESTLDRLN